MDTRPNPVEVDRHHLAAQRAYDGLIVAAEALHSTGHREMADVVMGQAVELRQVEPGVVR